MVPISSIGGHTNTCLYQPWVPKELVYEAMTLPSSETSWQPANEAAHAAGFHATRGILMQTAAAPPPLDLTCYCLAKQCTRSMYQHQGQARLHKVQ